VGVSVLALDPLSAQVAPDREAIAYEPTGSADTVDAE